MQTLYLRCQIANVLRSQGRYAEALAEDTDIHAHQREALGDVHLHTLFTAGGIAADLRGLGDSSARWRLTKNGTTGSRTTTARITERPFRPPTTWHRPALDR